MGATSLSATGCFWRWFGRTLSRSATPRSNVRGEPPPLTSRQRQLVSLIAAGLTNRQIARHLGLSEHTVRKHVENIFERLQVDSRTAAVTRAFPANTSADG
jgi:DNA-binding NarL/FixJ family response regulator